MDHSHDSIPSSSRSTGSAFRRVGATVAVACAVTGSIIGLGAMGALAAPSSSSVAAPAAADATTTGTAEQPAISGSMDAGVQKAKATYSDEDRAAFAASPYVDDAVNLAAIWGTIPEMAKGKAGSKIKAGVALPFAPGEALTYAYTPDQQRVALQMAGNFDDALRLASTWESGSLLDAKAAIGAKLLAHQPVPTYSSFTEEQDARAFSLWGYSDADAAQLAGLWQTDTHSAVVRAGAKILAGQQLPL